MPFVTADDGVRLHWEESGSGKPLLFIHEFAGDHRSFAPQVEHFRDRYRCLVYDARGYPPSDVPEDVGAYSQLRAVADAVTVLDAAGVERAHVVGVSMGGFCALHVGLRHPDRVDGLVIAGVGYGAHPDAAETFRAECEAVAAAFDAEGAAEVAKRYAVGPARVQFQNKNRAAWELFARQLAEHDSGGSARTMRGVQRLRPSLYDLRDELAAMATPAPDRGRRRGRGLPGGRPHAQAHRPHLRAGDPAPHRAHLQPRGARRLQRAGGALPRRRRPRRGRPARPALAEHERNGDGRWRVTSATPQTSMASAA